MTTTNHYYYKDRTQGTLKTKKIVQGEVAQNNAGTSSKSKCTYINP